jgi:hypothetical protein
MSLASALVTAGFGCFALAGTGIMYHRLMKRPESERCAKLIAIVYVIAFMLFAAAGIAKGVG